MILPDFQLLFHPQIRKLKKDPVLSSLITILNDSFPDPLAELIQNGQAAIVGGALTSLISQAPVHDWDVFFWKKNDWESSEKTLISHGFTCIKSGNDYYSFQKQTGQKKLIIDLVHSPSPSLLQYMDRIDFTVRKIAYTQNSLYHDLDFFSHVQAKKLIYTGKSTDHYKSALAIIKYRAKGYTIDTENLHRLFSDLGYTVAIDKIVLNEKE